MMEKIFENVVELITRDDYDKALSRVKELIKEATENGALNDSGADNEYIREIGRLGNLCAVYEDTKIQFKYIKVREKTPLVKSIEDEMYSRNIKQKELAQMLGINEPSLSQIMRGKRAMSMRTAKRLYQKLQIEPKLLIEYS